jgi:hypothetical protein
MVSNAPILPHTQVFNTYGERLTNAELLARYGFALDENEHDCITWDWSDLCVFAATACGAHNEPRGISGRSDNIAAGADEVMKLYGQVISLWPSASLEWTEVGFVYNPETNTASKVGKGYTKSAPCRPVLCLNGDGRISHHLWLYCALLGHQNVVGATDSSGVEEIVRRLQEMAGLLIQLAKEVSSLEDSSDDSSHNDNYGAGQQAAWRQLFNTPRRPIAEVVEQMIRTVLCLCRSRSTRIGKGLLNAMDIGEELDVRVAGT